MRNPANKQTNKQTNRHTKVIAISRFSRDNESFRPKVIMRDLRNIKNENALHFLFLLNHKLKKIPEFAPAKNK